MMPEKEARACVFQIEKSLRARPFARAHGGIPAWAGKGLPKQEEMVETKDAAVAVTRDKTAINILFFNCFFL